MMVMTMKMTMVIIILVIVGSSTCSDNKKKYGNEDEAAADDESGDDDDAMAITMTATAVTNDTDNILRGVVNEMPRVYIDDKRRVSINGSQRIGDRSN